MKRWKFDLDYPYDEHGMNLADLEDDGIFFYSSGHKYESPIWVTKVVNRLREILGDCLPDAEPDRKLYLQKLSFRSQLFDEEWDLLRKESMLVLEEVQALGYCTDEELQSCFMGHFRNVD